MAEPHDLVPLRLAEGQDGARAPVLGRGEDGDVNLNLSPVRGVRHDSCTHLAGQSAEDLGVCGNRVVAADRLEVRTDYLGQETGPGALPHRARVTDLEPGPLTAHDRLIKGDEGFRDAVPRAAGAEQVRLPGQQSAVFEDA